MLWDMQKNIGVVGTSTNSMVGEVSDSAFAQGGGTANNTHGATGKELELIRIFRLLDVRGRNKLLGAAFELEEGVTREKLGMKQVELLGKLQLASIDIRVPALSLLEGQKRPVSDFELNALADILDVSVDWLLGR